MSALKATALDAKCGSYSNDEIVVELARAKELAPVGGGLRLEGRGLPKRVIIARGSEDRYFAFENVCQQGKRRVDPVPGKKRVPCCSIGKTKYDFTSKPSPMWLKKICGRFRRRRAREGWR